MEMGIRDGAQIKTFKHVESWKPSLKSRLRITRNLSEYSLVYRNEEPAWIEIQAHLLLYVYYITLLCNEVAI